MNSKLFVTDYSESDLYDFAIDDFITDYYLDYEEEWEAYCLSHFISYRTWNYDKIYREFMEEKRDERFNA